MKILVISDSHGAFENIHKMYKKEKPDVVVFAGDHAKDAYELSYVKDKSEYYIVKGNTDYNDYDTPVRLEFDIDGYKFLLAHGHLYRVKYTYDNIIREGQNVNADVVIFGHTHEYTYENILGMYLFNPGAAKDGYYGVIEIKNGELYFFDKNINKGNLFF